MELISFFLNEGKYLRCFSITEFMLQIELPYNFLYFLDNLELYCLKKIIQIHVWKNSDEILEKGILIMKLCKKLNYSKFKVTCIQKLILQ